MIHKIVVLHIEWTNAQKLCFITSKYGLNYRNDIPSENLFIRVKCGHLDYINCWFFWYNMKNKNFYHLIDTYLIEWFFYKMWNVLSKWRNCKNTMDRLRLLVFSYLTVLFQSFNVCIREHKHKRSTHEYVHKYPPTHAHMNILYV